MLSILAWITGLAGPLSQIANKILALKQAQVTAAADTDKAKIDAELAEAHDRQAVLIAEAGNRVAGAINASARLLLSLGPITYILKIFLWDKVIGSFMGMTSSIFDTDKVTPEQWMVAVAVVALYLGYDLAAKYRK